MQAECHLTDVVLVELRHWLLRRRHREPIDHAERWGELWRRLFSMGAGVLLSGAAQPARTAAQPKHHRQRRSGTMASRRLSIAASSERDDLADLY